jgi:hypothetical protein
VGNGVRWLVWEGEGYVGGLRNALLFFHFFAEFRFRFGFWFWFGLVWFRVHKLAIS